MLRPIATLGKFEGGKVIDQYIYELSLEGCDEELGDITERAVWCGLLRGNFKPNAAARRDLEMTKDEIEFLSTRAGAIVIEYEQGFIEVEYYSSETALNLAWAEIARDLADEEREDY